MRRGVVTGDSGTMHFPFTIPAAGNWQIYIHILNGGGKVAIDRHFYFALTLSESSLTKHANCLIKTVNVLEHGTSKEEGGRVMNGWHMMWTVALAMASVHAQWLNYPTV